MADYEMNTEGMIVEKIFNFDMEWQQARILRYRKQLLLPKAARIDQWTDRRLISTLHVEERILIYLKTAHLTMRDGDVLPIHYEI